MRSIHWHRYPFLFLVIPLISGILASEYLTFIPHQFILYSIISLTLLLLWGSRLRSEHLLCIFSFLFLFLVGIYSHYPYSPSFTPGKTYTVEGRCEQILSPDKAIISSNGIRIFTRYRDSVSFSVGDSLRFDARLYPLSSTGNLYEFDYNTYLRHQNIQARGIPLSTPVKTGHSENLYSFCHSLQKHLQHKLATVISDSATFNLLSALCLGDRQNLSPDTKQLFQYTGTIHLLAISGLHIGAIYLFLFYILRLAGLRNRKYTLALIPLLWLITGITGLSPSACRAATILSFIIIGEAFYLDYVPLNAIAAAAFFTLLVQPELLYSVSFQMSYAAYTGIVLIYPSIAIRKKNTPSIVWKLYSLICISFSAQILTLPITAYYFHTVNLNSILFNLIAVPIATLLLYGGVTLLILPAFIGIYLSHIAAWITHFLIYALRLFSSIAINLTDLYPTAVHILFIYIVTLLLVFYLTYRRRNTLRLLCTSACLFVIFLYGYTFYRQSEREIVVYNHYQHSTILLNHDGYYTLLKNTDTTSRQLAYPLAHNLQPLPQHNGFIGRRISYLHNRLYSNKQTITIADRTHPNVTGQDILVITENTYPHPDTMMNSYPRQIILDQSNTPRCIHEWEVFCSQKQIPLFKTSELGSIVIPLR